MRYSDDKKEKAPSAYQTSAAAERNNQNCQEEKEKRQRQSDRANKWKEKYQQRIQHDKEVRATKKEKKMTKKV